MAKEQTDKSRYPSRYSPGAYITTAQYILELVCEKRARYLKKDLPVYFWRLPEWEEYYTKQLRMVHKLLKKYSSKAIIAAINKGNIGSLFVPWLIKSIEAEEKILSIPSTKEPVPDIIEVIDPTKVTFRKTAVKKTALSKLDEV